MTPPVRRRSRVVERPPSTARRLFIAWIVLVALAALGYVVWQLQMQVEREDAQARAWSEAQSRRVEYRSAAIGCGLTFPSGSADRAPWYEDDFRWRGLPAELATSSDDSEGEQWAEFYATPGPDALSHLLAAPLADARHPLIRRRLESQFYPSHNYEVETFDDRLQVYATGQQDGWQVRAAWFDAPFGNPSTYPPSGPRDAIDRRDIVDHLALESAWVWRALQDMPDPQLLAEYRRVERSYQSSSDAREREGMLRHFRNSHNNFYVIDAAKEVLPGKVLILRRFGQMQGAHSLAGAARRLHGMIRSVRCAAAAGAPGEAEQGAVPGQAAGG